MTGVAAVLVGVMVMLAVAGVVTELPPRHVRADPTCRRHRPSRRRHHVPCSVCIEERRDDAEARRFFDVAAGRTPRAPVRFSPRTSGKTAGQDRYGPNCADPDRPRP